MWQVVLGFLLGVAVVLGGGALWWRRWSRRRRVRQRELLRRTRRAERLAELAGMTGGLAHEIRNPLSAIKMNLQLLREDMERKAKQAAGGAAADPLEGLADTYQRWQRKMGVIAGEADRLADKLNDFLRLTGRMELQCARCDIGEVLDDLIDFYEPQAISKGVTMRRKLCEEPVYCRVDVNLVKQAMLNLFINAVQVMEAGGELMIMCRQVNGEVAVEVIDTGPGIEAERQEQIFEPYYSTRSGGTGLGLSICRRIIEEHHGSIRLHSEVGKGSKFTVVLPVVSE